MGIKQVQQQGILNLYILMNFGVVMCLSQCKIAKEKKQLALFLKIKKIDNRKTTIKMQYFFCL
jgi:hypothetical protein